MKGDLSFSHLVSLQAALCRYCDSRRSYTQGEFPTSPGGRPPLRSFVWISGLYCLDVMEFNDAMGVGDVGEWLIEKGFSTDIQEAFKSTFLCDYIFLCVECTT